MYEGEKRLMGDVKIEFNEEQALGWVQTHVQA